MRRRAEARAPRRATSPAASGCTRAWIRRSRSDPCGTDGASLARPATRSYRPSSPRTETPSLNHTPPRGVRSLRDQRDVVPARAVAVKAGLREPANELTIPAPVVVDLLHLFVA